MAILVFPLLCSTTRFTASIQTQGGGNQLAKYDGTSLSLINNPDAGYGYVGSPIVFNNALYGQYRNANYVNQLAKYDGTSLTLIANPDTPGNGNGYVGYPIVFNNALYVQYRNATGVNQVAKYDGTSLTLIANPDAPGNGRGYLGSPIVFNNALYSSYRNAIGAAQLVKFDGTSLTLIPNPDANAGYNGSPIVFNNALYGRYQNATGGFQLAKYDGTSSILIPNPDAAGNFGGYQGYLIVLNTTLYGKYRNANNVNQLATAVPCSLTVSVMATPSPTITAGGSVTLTASGATSYTWSNGASTTAITVSNVTSATAFSVTGITGGCSATASVSVAVSVTACTPPTVSLLNTGPGTCVGVASLSVGSSGSIGSLAWYNSGSLVFTSSPQPVTAGTTIAGTGSVGAAANQLEGPFGVYVDGSGSVYVADRFNNRIQKFPPNSTSATAGTTIAGTGTAGRAANQLNFPVGVYVDGSGAVYVSDQLNHRIQKFPPNSTSATNGITIAGGTYGTAANQLKQPTGVYVDVNGAVYVADQYNHRIQQFPPNSTSATNGTTIAGTGISGTAVNQLNFPTGVYIDGSGAVYVADQYNHRIQQFPPNSTSATAGTTIAGTGISGTEANKLYYPSGVYVDGSGAVYVADLYNNRIQKFPPNSTANTNGITVAGTGISGTAADQLNFPTGVYVNGSGAVYVADLSNNRIQQWAAGGVVSPVYAPSSAGSYSVVVTAADGCTATTNAVIITGPPSVSISPASQTITAGGSVTLTASGATSYAWSNGSAANPLIVSNVTSATAFSVTGTTGGCSASASASVAAAPSAALTLITSASPGSVCVGSSASLMVVASGGTGPYIYAWTAPTGAAITGATNTSAVSVSASTSGPKTFTVTVTGSGGSPVGISTVVIESSNVMVSVKDGLWSDPSTWSCNRVPVLGDRVSLQHRVTIPGGYVGQADTLLYGSTGQLVYETGGRLQLGQ